jgi:hypothetical protein
MQLVGLSGPSSELLTWVGAETRIRYQNVRLDPTLTGLERHQLNKFGRAIR